MTSPTPMRMPSARIRFVGPLMVAIAAVGMLIWSWGTWPDPLVDFGAQLYVPWQLASGQALYRDIAYYNGPLSSYLNATAFLIGGISLRTLVDVNLIILAATMVVVYRLTVRASGRGTAIMGGITFALVFAFGQTVLIGNYNWVTPYTHELTHGAALGLAAIACTARYQRNGKKLWLISAGILLGAVFLTKAEPTAASFAAVAVQLAVGWWGNRSGGRTIAKAMAPLIGSMLVLPLVAGALLAMAMPAHQAFRGVLGSWPWVFDRRITALAFYRNVTGLSDIAGNLATMLQWSGVYLALLGSGLCAGLFTRASNRTAARLVPAIAFVLVLAGLLYRFNQTNWSGMITPLPLCLCGALGVVAVAAIGRKTDASRGALRVSLVVFSLVLLVKMGLKPHVYHYGFVLAWPGTIVLVAAVATDLPAWIARRGGSGAVLRAVGLAAWIVAVSAILNLDAANFDSKTVTVSKGTPDEFRARSWGLEVQLACDRIRELIPANGTVAVFPQGLMINYLTRRANPIPNVNFMPPEVLAAGEDTYISAMQRHPPDVIVVTSTVIEDGHFTLDGGDIYGAKLLRWIQKNYQPVDVVMLQKPLPTIFRFMISRRKS